MKHRRKAGGGVMKANGRKPSKAKRRSAKIVKINISIWRQLENEMAAGEISMAIQ
jgi:hypothetical protein